jgi:hypothetical protein
MEKYIYMFYFVTFVNFDTAAATKLPTIVIKTEFENLFCSEDITHKLHTFKFSKFER